MNDSALDRAILAYRENPTESNRQLVLTLQGQHYNRFLQSQTEEFIRRTK